MTGGASDLDVLVKSVRASTKYRTVCPTLVRSIGETELSKRRGTKEAIKATKRALHQVAGCYLDACPSYDVWLEQLEGARHSGERAMLERVCRDVMKHQTSTRERLTIVDRFYRSSLESIAPIQSIVDLAAGLGPLAIPWMPLAAHARYYAYDVFEDMTRFLDGAIRLLGADGGAHCADVLTIDALPAGDVGFMLKCVPCLDHLHSHAAERILDTLSVRHFLVSFPLRSLGGSDKGMLRTYENRMEQLLSGRNWHVARFEFPGELAYLLSK